MGKIMRNKGGLVVDRPGRVLFVPVKADGTLDYVNAIRNTAVINTINITNTRTKTDIPDGNNMYPAGDRVTSIAGTIAIEFSTIDPKIWAMASGSELVDKATDTMLQVYDYEKISSEGTIVLNDKYATDGYISIIGADGTEYEKVSETPAASGEYSVASEGDKTTITFFADDKEKNVAITMMIETGTTSYAQGKKSMKYHKIVVSTEYSTLNDSEKILANLIISQASLGADMVDALQKDPSATKTLTFNMYAPLPGEEPYTVKFQDKKEA